MGGELCPVCEHYPNQAYCPHSTMHITRMFVACCASFRRVRFNKQCPCCGYLLTGEKGEVVECYNCKTKIKLLR